MKKKLQYAALIAVGTVLLLCIIPAVGRPQTFVVGADLGNTRNVEFTPLWTFQSDGMSYVESPIFADGLIYVNSLRDMTSPNGALYCIDASSGTQKWSNSGIFQTFTVANGYVYLCGEFSSVVSCIKASDGTQVWSYRHIGPPLVDGSTILGRGITALVDGSTVYVSGYTYTYSNDTNVGFILALNAYDGTKKWDFQGPIGTRFDTDSLCLMGGNLYAQSAVYTEVDRHWNSAVYAFDASTGEKLWNYSTPGIISSLTASSQNVYAASKFENTTDSTGGGAYEGGVLALNAFDGSRIWNYPISSSTVSPILANGTIYAVTGEGNVYALDVSNGNVIWIYQNGLSSPADDKLSGVTANPDTDVILNQAGSALLTNNYLYVGSSVGVHCFDALTGHTIWNFAAKEYDQSSATLPAYANGIVYFGWNGPHPNHGYQRVTQHDFYAIDAFSGEEIGNYTLGYAVNNSPMVLNGIIYIGASGVTPGSPDFPALGAVIALNSTITLSPSTSPSASPSLPPSPTPSPSVPEFPTWTATVVLAIISMLVIASAKKKNLAKS